MGNVANFTGFRASISGVSRYSGLYLRGIHEVHTLSNVVWASDLDVDETQRVFSFYLVFNLQRSFAFSRGLGLLDGRRNTVKKLFTFYIKVTSLLKTYFVHWMEEGKLKHEIQDFCFELSVDLWRI